MLKRFYKRISLNFKHSKSERSANNSYKNYNQKIKRVFRNINPFRKINKTYD